MHCLCAVLCGTALSLGLVACSDEEETATDTTWNPGDLGSNMEMAQTRAFILNEGSYGYNNARLTYFDYMTNEVSPDDVYSVQNGVAIGDTGQDIIEYGGYIYMSVYNSNYIAKLNGVGIEQARISFNDRPELGEIRYMAASGGYLYVTSYGGYVSKVDAGTLEYVSSVKVGANPEQITIDDGLIYCVNSGWGYDNTMSIISEATFSEAETVEIFVNPQAVISVDGTIVLQGFGGDSLGSWDYTYPVAIYDKESRTCTEIGKGTDIAGHDGTLYVLYTTTDYSTTPYSGSTMVYSYDIGTGAIDENPLDLPGELASGCTYGLSINPETGRIYIHSTNYTWGDGAIHCFEKDGTYLGNFSSYGQNPKKIVFLDD